MYMYVENSARKKTDLIWHHLYIHFYLNGNDFKAANNCAGKRKEWIIIMRRMRYEIDQSTTICPFS